MYLLVRHNNYATSNLKSCDSHCYAESYRKSNANNSEIKPRRFGWPFEGKEVTGEEAVHRR